MAAVCPISAQQVNARIAQLNAAITVVCVVGFLLTQVWAVAVLLLVDFFIRAFLNPAHSPFTLISKTVLKTLRLSPRMTNAGPKIFAARIGFGVVSLMLLSCGLNYSGPGVVLGAALAVFATLEAVFNFCVACKAYPLLRRFTNSAV